MQFDEVGWFYCSSDQTVIDRYVMFNYVENTWSIGQLSRTAWLDEGIFSLPTAAGKSSDTAYLYSHEIGYNADGDPMDNVYVQSADFDIGEGEEFQFIKRFIPDIKFQGSGSDQTINVQIKTTN